MSEYNCKYAHDNRYMGVRGSEPSLRLTQNTYISDMASDVDLNLKGAWGLFCCLLSFGSGWTVNCNCEAGWPISAPT